MKVYFAHGKESGPWGDKIVHLAKISESFGFDVESIDYRSTDDPDIRVNLLRERLSGEKDKFILVGSSMGAYVSLVCSEYFQTEGVFLMAPALFIPDYKVQTYQCPKKLTVVHGWNDELIPVENSIKFCRSVKANLHIVNDGHRLSESIDIIGDIFKSFCQSVLKF